MPTEHTAIKAAFGGSYLSAIEATFVATIKQAFWTAEWPAFRTTICATVESTK